MSPDDHAALQREEGRRRTRAESRPDHGAAKRPDGRTLKVSFDAKQWARIEAAARLAGQPVVEWAREAVHQRAVVAINKASQKSPVQ